MLLLHLAYSEEDLKFKAEIPPFPEPPNHKSQITNHNARQYKANLFPALRSGPTPISGDSRKKQIPSSSRKKDMGSFREEIR